MSPSWRGTVVKARAIVALVVLSVSACAVLAATADRLDGWGPYTFGMPIDQALVVPPLTWDKVTPQHYRARAPTRIGGEDYLTSIMFDHDGRLRYLAFRYYAFSNVGKSVDCKGRFLRALDDVEKRYGALAGRAWPGATVKHSRSGRSTYHQGTSPNVTEDISWRGGPYDWLTFRAAQRVRGDRAVRVEASHTWPPVAVRAKRGESCTIYVVIGVGTRL